MGVTNPTDAERFLELEADPSMRFCSRCGGWKERDEFAVDRARTAGRKNVCKACDSARSLARYYERRGRERPADVERRERCSECGVELEGRQRTTCGKAGCRESRFRRTNPEAYAAREAAKVERRREARRAARSSARSSVRPIAGEDVAA
jgi:hypothetical protein